MRGAPSTYCWCLGGLSSYRKHVNSRRGDFTLRVQAIQAVQADTKRKRRHTFLIALPHMSPILSVFTFYQAHGDRPDSKRDGTHAQGESCNTANTCGT